MHLHADAVAGAVGQPREPISRPEAPAFVDPPHSVIVAARRNARLGRGDRDLLSLVDLVPQLALLRRRLADDIGSADVGLVAVDRAGAVEEHDIAALDDMRLLAAMRVS